MGADLYIKDLDEDSRGGGFGVSKRAVDSGYFRDCYNSWGLTSLLMCNFGVNKAFSWWITVKREDLFRIVEEGAEENKYKMTVMTVEGIKKFYAEVKPILEKFKRKRKIYRDDCGYGKVEITDKEQIKMIKEHADLLMRFLELAIKLKSEIIWSV